MGLKQKRHLHINEQNKHRQRIRQQRQQQLLPLLLPSSSIVNQTRGYF